MTARFQLQAAAGAALSSLVVCAVAYEHGRQDPEEWIPLIATVVFDREIAITPRRVASDVDLDFSSRLSRGARLVWTLAGAFKNLEGIFEERPLGSRSSKALRRLPVAGKIAGGWFEERGALKKAVEEAQAALKSR